MTTMRYAAQSFLDGFTSMASIIFPAVRPGSEVPLFLADSPPDTLASVERTIMADVESFLHDVEPLLIENYLVHRESQVLLTKIQKSRNTLAPSRSGT